MPLPFAGLSYVDFNLFGTGTQFSGFFGGSYGQLAFSAPSLGGTRWQLAGRAFAIASSYNDRAFVEGASNTTLEHPAAPRAGVGLAAAAADARASRSASATTGITPGSRAATSTDAGVRRAGRPDRPRRAASRSTRSAAAGTARSGGTRRIRTGWRTWGVPGYARVGDPAQRRLPAVRRVTCCVRRVIARGWSPGSRRRGWAAAISIASAATRSARSTIDCTAIRRRLFDTIAAPCCAAPLAWSASKLRAPGRLCRRRRGARSGFRPRVAQLHRLRRGGRSAGAVRHAGRGRVGLRLARRRTANGTLGTQVVRVSGYKVF